jgi:hypothetical protein
VTSTFPVCVSVAPFWKKSHLHAHLESRLTISKIRLQGQSRKLFGELLQKSACSHDAQAQMSSKDQHQVAVKESRPLQDRI